MPSETTTQHASAKQDAPRRPPAQPLSAEDAKARRDVLADVEAQCASHGRHPAEWDTSKSVWISPDEPAVPYAVITAAVAPPKRCREVVCELLAAGVPVACTAHQALADAADQKRFVKAARKLVTALRDGPSFAAHISAAVGLGVIHKPAQEYHTAVRKRLASGEDADAATEAVAEAMPDAAGSITMAMLDKWTNAMPEAEYSNLVKAARQVLKGAGSAEEADGASAIGSISEKIAQYLAGFYHQEVKQAKARHAQGKPPQPVIQAAGKRKAPDEGRLPELPPGCRWGYCTPDRFFVPFDPVTRQMGDTVKVADADGSHAAAAAGVGPSEGDSLELKQLTHLYHPVLWAPEKAAVADRAWSLFSAEDPGMERTDAALKAAAAAMNAVAVRDLRVEHFSTVAARELVREVALAVQARVTGGAFAPSGSVAKAREALKVKALALQLPERDESLGDPAARLLALEFTPPPKGGPSAKRQKA